jgi:alanine racemase
LTLKSRIVALRDVDAGTRASYGGTFTFSAPGRIATVPIGYGDGMPRGKHQVLIAGRRHAVIGAVTMEMVMVDVTGCDYKLGDEVVLIGSQGDERIDATDIAARGNRIVWEVFTGISKRVPRVYTGERW